MLKTALKNYGLKKFLTYKLHDNQTFTPYHYRCTNYLFKLLQNLLHACWYFPGTGANPGNGEFKTGYRPHWRKYEGVAMCEKATCAKYSKI